MRPLWRWWLFCVALWLSWHLEWTWAGRLMAWCVLPEWVADEESRRAFADRELSTVLEDSPW